MFVFPVSRFFAAILLATVLSCAAVRAADDPVPLRRVAVASVAELAAAVNRAQPGDEIVIAPGTYDVSRIRLAANGSAAHPIVLRAERRGAVLLRATAVEAFVISGAYWVVDGLDILGVCEPQEKCEHAFHIVGDADNVVIRDNRARDFNATIKSNGFEDVKRFGAEASGKAWVFPDNVLISGNYFFNTTIRQTATPVTLMDIVGGRNWIIRGNLVADFQKGKGNRVSYGMFLKGNSRNGIFERNLVMCEWQNTGGTRMGISLGGGGSGPPKICEDRDCSIEHTDGIIRNNIILNCTQDVGIYLNKAKNSKIYNNTVINTAGIDIRFKASTADLRNNIVSGKIRDRDGGDHSEANNLVHPHPGTLMGIYADIARGNFRLLNEREVMGKGRRVREVTDDFCGRPRRLPAYDLGAIEYGPGRCNTTEMMREALEFGGAP